MAVSNKYLKQLSDTFGLKECGNALYDIAGGVPLTISYNNYSILVQFPMDKSGFMDTKQALTDRLVEAGCGKPSWSGGFVVASVKKPKTLCDQYDGIKKAISGVASQYAHNMVCPFCGNPGCDVAVIKNSRYVAAHKRCYESDFETSKDVIVQGGGNYITGTIGALLGALLLVVVAFALIVYTQTAFGWLFAAMTVAALTGYRILKGPYGGGGMTIVAVSSVVVFICYLYAEVIWELCNYLDFTVAECLAELGVGALTQIVFSAEFISASWFEILFFLVGFVVIIATKPLSKNKQVADMEQMRDAVSPLKPNIIDSDYGTDANFTNEADSTL